MASLYDKFGGEGTVLVIVSKMYERILGDDRISYFFADTDMAKLRRMNAEFVTIALGAPHKYTGRSLREAHRHLVEQGLNDQHFDIVSMHLTAAMNEVGLSTELIAEGKAIVESVRNDVLGK